MWPFSRNVKNKVNIEFGGTIIDLLPIAQEVLELPDCKLDMSAGELADWAFEFFNNPKYVKIKDRPAEHDWEHLKNCISRVGRWAIQQHRLPQIVDPDVIKMRPRARLVVTEELTCVEARALAGVKIKNKKVQRLPFKSCPLEQTCHCGWVTLSKRDL